MNLTFDDIVRTARQAVAVSASQSTPSSQSSANTTLQNPLSVMDYPSNVTETASTRIAPYTIITDPVTNHEYVNGQVIVRFKSQNNGGPSISNDKIRMAHAKVGAKVKKDFSAEGVAGLQVVQLPNGTYVQSAIKEYQSNPDVLYAEPDYVISIVPDQTGPIVQDVNPLQILSTSNDPLFTKLWGLRNTGQTILSSTGTPGADINATAAWDISTGSNSVIVAVIDTGVLYTHSDLSTNIWTNPGEIPGNGLDDDHNGYIDDVYGWNFVTNTSDPIDDKGHGTHVSGTIGAVGNNAIGVTGVNWNIKIMALKAFDASGYGFTSDAISAILYADAKGASVISNSWSGSYFSQSLEDTIDASPAVVVCAAGNIDAQNPEPDNDLVPQYPASFTSVNIISVAATDQNDQLASFSHYGLNSVDLAAPGVNILSTLNVSGTYGYMSGTSMATPHVSGVAALVKSVNQSLTAVQIKNIILSTVDEKSSLSGNVSTGGRLNAYRAVVATPPAPPVANFTGTPTIGTAPLTVVFTNLSTNRPTAWHWTFGDGNVTNATDQNPVHTYLTGGNYTVSMNVTNAGGFDTMTKVGYINVSSEVASEPYGIGVYRPSAHTFYLKNGTALSWTTTATDWGISTDLPVTGDWNGDSITDVGVYRPSAHMFYLKNGTALSWTTTAINWGISTDLPVTGKWG